MQGSSRETSLALLRQGFGAEAGGKAKSEVRSPGAEFGGRRKFGLGLRKIKDGIPHREFRVPNPESQTRHPFLRPLSIRDKTSKAAGPIAPKDQSIHGRIARKTW